MKTKKIVIGAMAAAMLSLSVCSLMPAAAAGEKVQISVGKANAKAGEEFSVEVSLADIPSTGIQACNFSIEFDSKVVTITDVKEGALSKSGANSSDPSASLLAPFNFYTDNNEGTVSVMWSTSLDDASYWLKGEGVLCTITGKVASGAKDGDKTDLKIVPTKRESSTGSGVANDEIDCGYLKSGEKVSYGVDANNGVVTVGNGGGGQGGTAKLIGDANNDGQVSVADAAAILQYLGNNEAFPLDDDGLANADCDGKKGVTPADAVKIQKVCANLDKF